MLLCFDAVIDVIAHKDILFPIIVTDEAEFTIIYLNN